MLQPWPSLLKSIPAWSEEQEQESVLLLAKLAQPLVPWRTSSWFLKDFVFGEFYSNKSIMIYDIPVVPHKAVAEVSE